MRKPKKLTGRRMYKKNNKAVSQVLISWSGEDVSDAMWEDYHPFVAKYPDSKLGLEEVLSWTWSNEG